MASWNCPQVRKFSYWCHHFQVHTAADVTQKKELVSRRQYIDWERVVSGPRPERRGNETALISVNPDNVCKLILPRTVLSEGSITWQGVPRASYRVSTVQCPAISIIEFLIFITVTFSLFLCVFRRSLKWHPVALLCPKAFGWNQWNAVLSDLFHLRDNSWKVDFSWWQDMDYFIWIYLPLGSDMGVGGRGGGTAEKKWPIDLMGRLFQLKRKINNA